MGVEEEKGEGVVARKEVALLDAAMGVVDDFLRVETVGFAGEEERGRRSGVEEARGEHLM